MEERALYPGEPDAVPSIVDALLAGMQPQEAKLFGKRAAVASLAWQRQVLTSQTGPNAAGEFEVDPGTGFA